MTSTLNNDTKNLTKLSHNSDSLPMNMTSASISNNFDNDYIILCLYVDDILIFGTSLDVIQRIKDYLSQNFDMKNLGSSDRYWEWRYPEPLMKFH